MQSHVCEKTGLDEPLRNDLAPSHLLEHATSWFTYHATQRMQSFNFFVVFQGALVVAAFQQGADKWKVVVASGIGVVVAIAFFILEVRNTELVNHGRAALDKIAKLSDEKPMSLKDCFPRNMDTKRRRKHRRWQIMPVLDKTPPRLVTHTFVLRALILASGLAWSGILIADGIDQWC